MPSVGSEPLVHHLHRHQQNDITRKYTTMPPTRPPVHDPFTSNPGPSLRTQPSQSSLRSNASAASSRTRQNRSDNLFAPSLSRRPTSRVEIDEVLADTSSDQETENISGRRPRPHLRRLAGRHGSPAEGRRPVKKRGEDEQDIVKRDSSGNYLLGGCEVPGANLAAVYGLGVDEEEKRIEEVNAYYSALARRYFTSGAGLTTSRRVDEDYERDRPELMYCLKAEVIQKLENEKWLYEPVDRLQPGLP